MGPGASSRFRYCEAGHRHHHCTPRLTGALSQLVATLQTQYAVVAYAQVDTMSTVVVVRSHKIFRKAVMISLSTLLVFLLAVFTLLSPGPNMAFVLSHGNGLRPRGGFAAALGIGWQTRSSPYRPPSALLKVVAALAARV